MRTFFLSAILCGASVFGTDFVNQLPNGHYAGHGNWSDNAGHTGTYATYVEITNNEMRVDYSYDDQSITVFLSFLFTGSGVFDVIYEGGVAGQGYCETARCYYQLNARGMNYSENLSFNYDAQGSPTLSKIGYKQTGDRVVHWQDGLFYVNLDGANPVILPVPADDQTQQK